MSMAMDKIHYLLLLSFSLDWLAMMVASNNITTDQSALLAFRDQMMITSEPHQILANNWSVFTSSVCDWIGVTCGSRHRRVTALNVSNMSLTGTIPPQLGNLSFLVSLDLSRNNFHGQLPRELAHLRRLRYLDFGVNILTGELPSWLGYLQKLQYLSLRNNSFTGYIPSSISNLSNLETIWLSNNSIEGTIPIEFQNLGNLKNLIIENNQLSGPLPLHTFNISSMESISFGSNSLSGILSDNICHGLQKLIRIDLSNNNFNGQIPSTFSQCSLLQTLQLSGNHFTGPIPKEIGNLTMLEILNLGINNLRGAIPNDVWNLTMLMLLDLGDNNLTGVIPEKVGSLQRLETLHLFNNSLSGSIPKETFNISALHDIGLEMNDFSGTIPSTIGDKLSNLQFLTLQNNDLSGVIPNSISNASKLTWLTFQYNGFTGSIPNSLGNLRNLQMLNFASNMLSSESSSTELSFLTSLTSCRSLRYLIVSSNPLNGFLPASFSNYSTSLQSLIVSRCKIKGNIPNNIGNLSSLLVLDTSYNELIGYVPRAIYGLKKLQQLDLSFNKIREPLDVFCELHRLGELRLSRNQFSGPLPSCLGNLTSLSKIYLDSNNLTSKIPASLWNIENLQELNLSSNFLIGSLPLEIGNLKVTYLLDLSINQLSGIIPSTTGGLQNLIYLSLGNNTLEGSIPQSIGNMVSLETLNLSHNNLSGWIPKSLEALQYLKEFNVSFNRLRGEIPFDGPFKSFTSKSFMYNEALCGNVSMFNVPPCPRNSRKTNMLPSVQRNPRQLPLPLILTFSGIAAIGLVMFGVVVILRCRKKQKVLPSGIELLTVETCGRFSYYDLLQATDDFNERNLLGNGGSCSVYCGILNDGVLVAIKVFNLHLEGAFKRFDAECEVLWNLRHRNLTKMMGNCSKLDFKALVLQYMPNGSLEKWLYSPYHFLDLIQRVNIMIDVACALEYLHFGYTTPVVHCDLKPSNILLDEDMVGHVIDFGVAKILGEGESIVHSNTLATLGYIAPEYGSGGLVSTRIDVYSFGIILMEIFSRKKPCDEMFSGDLSLKRWVEDSLPNALQVIDANLIKPEEKHFNDKLECVIRIMKLALRCSQECPGQRINSKVVLAELKKIKHQLLSKVSS